MKALAISFTLALVLAGCQSNRPHTEASPYYGYPRGLGISLVKPLEIPPDSATVRLQYGRVVARNGVEESQPHCIFEIATVRDTAQPVAPDSFAVTRIQRRVQTFSGMPVFPYYTDYNMKVGWGDDDYPSHLYYLTEFRLHSDRQPLVRSLTCQSNQMAAGIAIMRHLTLAEIRGALGDYFRLDIPS
jgi:hypothetical protein